MVVNLRFKKKYIIEKFIYIKAIQPSPLAITFVS